MNSSSESSEPKNAADSREEASREEAAESAETAATPAAHLPPPDAQSPEEAIARPPEQPEPPVGATAFPSERQRRRGLLATVAIGLALLWLLAIGTGLWIAGMLPGLSSHRADQILALPDRVAALERQLRELSNRPSSAPDAPRLSDIEARLDRLEASASAPRPTAADPTVLDRLNAVEARADQALAAAKEAASRAQSAADTAQKANPEAPPNAVERGDLDALSQRVTGLVDGLSHSVRGLIDRLSQRLAGLEQQITGVDQQVKANEDRFSKVGPGADQAVRVAIVALELRLAVERGGSFSVELAAAEQVAENPSLLEPLRAFVTTGVPSAPTLAQNLSKLAPAMIEAVGAKAHGTGIIERLEASAERLVRAHPIEESAGDAPSIVISRAEIKANRGDIAGAVGEIEKLPDPVRAQAADWIKTAKGRLAAIEAVRQFTTQSLNRLVKSAG
jgi:hypothetical protein